MTSLLGALFSWQALVGLVIGAVLVYLIYKFGSKNPDTVNLILTILGHAEGMIEWLLPDAYEDVYKALLTALNKVADGEYTRDEAIETARDAFKLSLQKFGVELTASQQEFADRIIVFAVEMLIKDSNAASVAVKSMAATKGLSL